MSSYVRRIAFATSLVAATALPAFAQSFPDGRPIEMTVMFGAGSASDITARQLADGMAKVLGVPVPVVAPGHSAIAKPSPMKRDERSSSPLALTAEHEPSTCRRPQRT